MRECTHKSVCFWWTRNFFYFTPSSVHEMSNETEIAIYEIAIVGKIISVVVEHVKGVTKSRPMFMFQNHVWLLLRLWYWSVLIFTYYMHQIQFLNIYYWRYPHYYNYIHAAYIYIYIFEFRWVFNINWNIMQHSRARWNFDTLMRYFYSVCNTCLDCNIFYIFPLYANKNKEHLL